MTLVGPRPSNEVVTWQDGQTGKFQRYLFTCGLTGPFQTQKILQPNPYKAKWTWNIFYIAKITPVGKLFLKDITIIGQTVLTVLRAKGI